MYLIRDLYLEHIKSSYNSVIKMGQRSEFLQRGIKMPKKHMKRCSKSLVIREMLIKTTVPKPLHNR